MKTNLPEAQRQDSQLPTFPSIEVAEWELFAMRDESLRWLDQFARKKGRELKYDPDALASLEDLYFEQWDGTFASRLRRNRPTFEFAMGMFLGAVAVGEHRATWTIYESPFAKNHFGIGVTRRNLTVVLNSLGSRWDRRPGNKRRRLLRRMYDRFFAAD
jgi:hypothetical protein